MEDIALIGVTGVLIVIGIIIIFYLICIYIFYFIIKKAVKNGIIEAEKQQEKDLMKIC